MAKKPTYEELEQKVKEFEKGPDEKARFEDRLQILSLAINQSSEGIAVANLDGNLEYLNAAFAIMHGYSPEELVGKKLSIFHSPEQLPSVDAANRQLKETENFNGEIWHIRRDGTEFPTLMHNSLIKNAEGKPIGMLGTIRDISDMKQAKEKLENEKHEKEMILDSLLEHVVYQNLENKILWANRAACESVHKTREALVGQNCYEIWCGRQSVCEDCPVKKTLKTGNPQAIYKTTPDGRVWYIQGCLVRDINRNIVGVVELTLDITDRRRAKEEKKKLEAQLQMSQRMEAVGTLAGGIAHDFNNLLMGIQGNTSLMFQDIDSSHTHYERLKSIEKQIQSGVKLTSQLLGYARKGRYEVIPLSLNQIVNETSDTFERTRKEIVIHKKLAEDLFAIEADQGQIEQVLLNLFVNAADAMPHGGNLYLETKNVTKKDLKNKPYKPTDDKYVLLIVKDTGIGMDKSTAEHIFEPFFTTKEMGKGTGLGLASVYGIIKAHGGYIDVESKEKHGTTFKVYLPATKRKIKKVTKTSDELIKRTGTVLLVDDEEIIQDVCKDMLKTIGYKVLSAKDGKKAIKIYRKNQNDIDIVLLDMIMPIIGGGEVYDRLKEINPDIKVLLSSGYTIDSEATEILNRGCDGFIQKPFNINDLSQKIREVLKKK